MENGQQHNHQPEDQVEATLAVAHTETKETKPPYAHFLLPGAILLGALIVSGTLLYTRGSFGGGKAQINGAGSAKQEEPVEVKLGPNEHMLGSQNAKVTIVEFSDFQCPFCRRFWSDALPQIKKEYLDTGKAKFIYKHYPLSFHAGAKPAAEASECANDQSKFWEYHDKIFAEQEKQGQGTIQFGKPELKKWAGQIGLNVSQFNQCLDSGKYSKLVDDNFAYGSELGVSGTPTTFINGQRLVGAQPFASFKTIIDGILK